MGFQTKIFSLNADKSTKKLLLSKKEFINLIQDKNNLMLIHYGSYWNGLFEHIQMAKCPIIFKYHNITPSYFFEKYNDYVTLRLGEKS